jgi:DNA-binding MarR family transcriptional regulator
LHIYIARMTTPDGPDLCHSLAARRSARHLARLYDRHIAPAGITSSQFSILSLLERQPGISVAELARQMVMERTTLVRALRPLQEAGLVRSDTADRGRALKLSATSAGLRKIAEALPGWEAAQAEFEAAFGRDRAARLRDDVLEFTRVR